MKGLGLGWGVWGIIPSLPSPAPGGCRCPWLVAASPDLPLLQWPSSWCVFSPTSNPRLLSLIRIPIMGLRIHAKSKMIPRSLSYFHPQKPLFQITSHSQVSRVRTWMYLFSGGRGGTHFNPVQEKGSQMLLEALCFPQRTHALNRWPTRDS